MALDADITRGLPDEPAEDEPYVKFEPHLDPRRADLVFTRATHSQARRGLPDSDDAGAPRCLRWRPPRPGCRPSS